MIPQLSAHIQRIHRLGGYPHIFTACRVEFSEKKHVD